MEAHKSWKPRDRALQRDVSEEANSQQPAEVSAIMRLATEKTSPEIRGSAKKRARRVSNAELICGLSQIAGITSNFVAM